MVNMHEAKTNLSRLVASLEAGDVDEIEIARAGQVVARLVPPRPRRPDRQPGGWEGRIVIHDDFDDELPEDILAAFNGELP